MSVGSVATSGGVGKTNDIAGPLSMGALVVLISLVLAGCNALGPNSVRNGRGAYNEAIVQTNQEQMLMSVVRNRYLERSSLLAVTSITANVSLSAGAIVEAGFGDKDNYEGNLTPFTGTVFYEENPTISYTPVDGEQYLHRLFSPLSVEAVAELAGGFTDPAPVYWALIEGVNGAQNPAFLFAGSAPDPRFARFVELMTRLKQANRLHWVKPAGGGGDLAIVIDHFAEDYAAEVDELLEILSLPAVGASGGQVSIPVSLALDGRKLGGIGLSTRPIFKLVEILSASVHVPEADIESGRATRFPPLGVAGQSLKVLHSSSRPDNALVAVRHREGWFYIDDRDLATKGYFRLMEALWSATIAESTSGAASPVLTVPVGR